MSIMARIKGWFDRTESATMGNQLQRNETWENDEVGIRHLDNMEDRIVEGEIKSGPEPEA